MYDDVQFNCHLVIDNVEMIIKIKSSSKIMIQIRKKKIFPKYTDMAINAHTHLSHTNTKFEYK